MTWMAAGATAVSVGSSVLGGMSAKSAAKQAHNQIQYGSYNANLQNYYNQLGAQNALEPYQALGQQGLAGLGWLATGNRPTANALTDAEKAELAQLRGNEQVMELSVGKASSYAGHNKKHGRATGQKLHKYLPKLDRLRELEGKEQQYNAASTMTNPMERFGYKEGWTQPFQEQSDQFFNAMAAKNAGLGDSNAAYEAEMRGLYGNERDVAQAAIADMEARNNAFGGQNSAYEAEMRGLYGNERDVAQAAISDMEARNSALGGKNSAYEAEMRGLYGNERDVAQAAISDMEARNSALGGKNSAYEAEMRGLYDKALNTDLQDSWERKEAIKALRQQMAATGNLRDGVGLDRAVDLDLRMNERLANDRRQRQLQYAQNIGGLGGEMYGRNVDMYNRAGAIGDARTGVASRYAGNIGGLGNAMYGRNVDMYNRAGAIGDARTGVAARYAGNIGGLGNAMYGRSVDMYNRAGAIGDARTGVASRYAGNIGGLGNAMYGRNVDAYNRSYGLGTDQFNRNYGLNNDDFNRRGQAYGNAYNQMIGLINLGSGNAQQINQNNAAMTGQRASITTNPAIAQAGMANGVIDATMYGNIGNTIGQFAGGFIKPQGMQAPTLSGANSQAAWDALGRGGLGGYR